MEQDMERHPVFVALAQSRQDHQYQRVLDSVPYAAGLGMQVTEAAGELWFTLPYQERHVGNMLLPALHGGVIGGFMECCAQLYILWRQESEAIPLTVDFAIDYLRSGRAQDTYAACHLTRQGKRVAHITIEAWQEDRSKPIAVARAHCLLT
ncbi:PaaI family thioesterase [Leeia aquatica]|uniref:PaaI family thioesterase n=2 Tax=Leeia TaxID=650341 RepID=A0A847S4K1_9NEIS|nr:PaaI family thioesterase [Leeia aquatica]NLR74723.1 PaaI family thioesterase [Leeia aquatica]